MSPPLVIIDCDAGVDDAEALIMALSHHTQNKIKILAITTVDGNTNVDNATGNVLRVLQLFPDCTVPIYKGTNRPLCGELSEVTDANSKSFHGEDGFGGVAHTIPVDSSLVSREPAAVVIGNIISQFPNQITLITLAPLTNIALALRIKPSIATETKEIFIMGGDVSGRGNRSDFVSAEFNIGHDPEAAAIVLREFTCPKVMLPFDTCGAAMMPWEWYKSLFEGGKDCPKTALMSKLCGNRTELKLSLQHIGYYSCDPYAMTVFLYPECVLVDHVVPMAVELDGKLTRGQTVVDWDSRAKTGFHKVRLVTKLDTKVLMKAYEAMLAYDC